MYEPGALLECLKRGAEGALVNELLQPVEVLEGRVPVLQEYLGRQLAPHPVQVVGVRWLHQDPVEVEVLARSRVVPALVLHLKKLYKKLYYKKHCEPICKDRYSKAVLRSEGS